MYLVLGKENCSWCKKVKDYLAYNNKPFIYIDIKEEAEKGNNTWLDFVMKDLSAKTVPQILKLTNTEEVLNGF